MKRLVLYGLLALQVGGLLALYAWHALPTGPRYLLNTRPVDPRDPLRGDFVILAYDISTPPAGWTGTIEDGKTVFVRLKPVGAVWEIDRLADAAENDGAPWLRARWDGSRLEYGIGKYFVPEGRGNPPGKITVEITIRDRAARIAQLYNDGQPWP